MVLQILFLGPSNLLEPNASFTQMSQKLIVSPIVKTLVFNKIPEKVSHLLVYNQLICSFPLHACYFLAISGERLDWPNRAGLEVQENNPCTFRCSNQRNQIRFVSSVCISRRTFRRTLCYTSFTVPPFHFAFGKGWKLFPSRWHENLIISWSVLGLRGSC